MTMTPEIARQKTENCKARIQQEFENEVNKFLDGACDVNIHERADRGRSDCLVDASRYTERFVDRAVERLNEAGWKASKQLNRGWEIKIEW